MNALLIFFAFPIATILLAIVLEKVLDSPILVGLTFFAIYLVITFAFFDSDFLILAIIYTALAVLTAIFVRFVRNCLMKICCQQTNFADQTSESAATANNDPGTTVILTNVNPNSCQQNNPRVITGRIQLNGNNSNGRCCCRR